MNISVTDVLLRLAEVLQIEYNESRQALMHTIH